MPPSKADSALPTRREREIMNAVFALSNIASADEAHAWQTRPAILLLKQRELFSQIQVLGCKCAARPRSEHQETHEIVRDGRQRCEATFRGPEDENA